MDTDDNAFELIDSFAKELLALNGNKKIPTIWMIRLKGQLQKTSTTKPGVKRDDEETREIVKQITIHGKEISAERTKHHSPAKAKNRIASELNVSRKKIDRIIDEDRRLDSLAPETRKPHIEGKARAIIANVLSDLWESVAQDRTGDPWVPGAGPPGPGAVPALRWRNSPVPG